MMLMIITKIVKTNTGCLKELFPYQIRFLASTVAKLRCKEIDAIYIWF